jgi:uncharacterized protein (DUF1810 family)
MRRGLTSQNQDQLAFFRREIVALVLIDEGDLSSDSILSHLKLLKALFTYAFDNDHITTNPMARIKYSAGDRPSAGTPLSALITLLLSPPLAKRLTSAGVHREVRGREKASDHGPAWVELAEPTKASLGRARRLIKDGEMTVADPFDLKRFVTAQTPVFETVLAELRAGRKRSHWMWFVFPQLVGLGQSPTAGFYGISSINEARAYLAHKLLGARVVLTSESTSLHAIFGLPDDMKFRSCVTLFSRAADDPDNPFRKALDRWAQIELARALTVVAEGVSIAMMRSACGGQPDQRTLALID